jgi:oligopeptide transport system substrate-binding protein
MAFVAFLIVAVGVVFVVVLASGGDDDNAPASDGTPAKNNTPKSGSAAGVCSGNTLVVPGSEPQNVLDPIQVDDVATSEYIVEIFGGLVTLDRELKVQPDIAKSWDISADGKTYTFHLRDNVLFHSGKRVTAKDIQYSLERAADPVNASPTVVAYLGDVLGVKEKANGKAPSISGLKVIDDQTVQITLTEPADFFLAELAYPVSFVVNKEQIEKDPRNWTRKPDGTGPFKMAEFSPAEKIRLVRNDRYHLGVAKLDEVVFDLGGSSVSTRYENDELHIGGVPAQSLEDVVGGQSPLSAEYHPIPNMATFYLNVNPSKAPFDDPKVRQAFAMAIDRESINKVLLYGYFRVADGFLPPEMPGYKESVHSYSFDPVKARQVLSESSYGTNLPRITFTYGGSGGNSPEILVAIQKGWQDALGVTVELQAVEPSAFLRERRKGTFQIADDGWSADYPDPENFLGKLFASDSQLNYTHYKNADVDNLLRQARSETDRQKRYDLYAQAEQKIVDDAVTIPTFWPVEHMLIKPCVKNYPPISMTAPKYRYIEIDQNAK